MVAACKPGADRVARAARTQAARRRRGSGRGFIGWLSEVIQLNYFKKKNKYRQPKESFDTNLLIKYLKSAHLSYVLLKNYDTYFRYRRISATGRAATRFHAALQHTITPLKRHNFASLLKIYFRFTFVFDFSKFSIYAFSNKHFTDTP
ncbi:hypothetical protein O3301_01310 [Janthinobacterium sp. SUN211]|nr:hypothetical protein [Janthinobacterium sp. SUN211]